ncbi:hypothetical protein FZZ93_08920 [Halomonas eurihalina]|uniref:Uncharacterized protein n=1 Tax=Halomonas eurihalina TaxID=42566 RepID=A0A5D9D8Z6_HALER|nr:hypothetical protein [Halomonas eurihalina]MDR5859934.1 hypothetical protein [Halomonas eurihalina]TZG39883.1 hypothetical protein FZZ93_08920 [Halomonas eurihalina]
MIKVKVNDMEREWSEINPNWIHDQIKGRQQAGQSVCVIVKIRSGDVNVLLSAGDCPSSTGGGGSPNVHEQEVFDFWERVGMKKDPINSGNLVAFLKQAERI